jgi:hypothetical protein
MSDYESPGGGPSQLYLTGYIQTGQPMVVGTTGAIRPWQQEALLEGKTQLGVVHWGKAPEGYDGLFSRYHSMIADGTLGQNGPIVAASLMQAQSAPSRIMASYAADGRHGLILSPFGNGSGVTGPIQR